MRNTCGHCESGRIGAIVCPHCWGTTVSSKVLAQAKTELDAIRKMYAQKRDSNKSLGGRARGMAGQALSKIGAAGRELREEVDQVEREVATNKAMLRMAAAAAQD